MNKNYLTRILIGVGVIAASCIVAPSAANAVGISDDWQAGLIGFWDEYDVPNAVQQSLIAEISVRGFTDAETDATPISSEEIALSGLTRQIATYADGSIKVSDVQLPSSLQLATARAASPASVHGCVVHSFSGGSNWTQCAVDATTALITIGFFADLTTVQGEYNDYIVNKGYTPYENCTLGVCTQPTFDSWKQHETSSGRAYLRYVSTYTADGPIGSTTNHVRLLVGNNTATSDGK